MESNEILYNETIVNSVINGDADLKSIFDDCINDGEEPSVISENIFRKLILSRNDYTSSYLKFISKKNVNEVIPEVVNKVKVEKKYPRRYGKVDIMLAVEKQGTPPTTLQRAMLELNDFKNMYSTLSTKLIKDTFCDDKKLSEENYLDIIATIKILKNRLTPIIKLK